MFSLKKILPLLLFPCLLFPCLLSAQVQDDFSDGDHTTNPAWQGDVQNFTVNPSAQLQLNAPNAGTSTLYLPTLLADSALWELYFRLDFDPSGSNSLRIALQADSENFATASGYFLALGETGSNDAIRFTRQDAGSETLLATATPGAVATSPTVRLRIERSADGTWTLLADYAGNFNYAQEFSVADATYLAGSYVFGLQCAYTATRTDKFFFDDIRVDELLPDTEAPLLLSANPLSATEVDVTFNEPLDEATATDPDNFSISGGVGSPAAAFLDGTDPTLVHLALASPLANQTNYVLTASGLADAAGNVSAAQTAGFFYLEIETATEFDLLINELLPDPNPSRGLPDAEFVEILNRSAKVIDLAGHGLSNGGTPQTLPSYLLFPGELVIVCDDSAAAQFAPFGNVVVLGSFPTLSNSGDDVILTGPAGNVIHQLSYSLGTYGDASKSGGGWSLELVNPLAPCAGEANYRAATSLLGGTPGQPNSVRNAQPDTDGPQLVRSFAQPTSVTLFFDEILEKTTAENVANYSVSGGAVVVAAQILPPANTDVRLTLGAALATSEIYEVQIGTGLTDCEGNGTVVQTTTFALPEPIGRGELLVNEILFDPPSGGGDFVEIFNPTNKIFNLGDLIIGNDTVISPVTEDRLIFPGEYAVIAEAEAHVLDFFTVKNPGAILVNDLPAFNADQGNVTLRYQSGPEVLTIDSFDYDVSLHAPLLDEEKGVSLERIDPARPTQAASNWHSAAATVGYATPTYLNSQHLLSGSVSAGFFDLPEKKLSPDGDGFQDFLVVNYQLDQAGYSVRAQVFDAEGRPVKTVFDNELLGTEGFFRWDGDTDEGGKARLGIYVLWIQLFHPDGTVREFKETCVVAGRL